MVITVLFIYENTVLDSSGQNLGVWDIGEVIYSCIILTVTVKLCLETKYVWLLLWPFPLLLVSFFCSFYSTWTILHHIAIFGSLLVYCIFILVWDLVFAIPLPFGSEVFYTIYRLAAAPSFYAALFLVPTAALMRDVAWKLYCPYTPFRFVNCSSLCLLYPASSVPICHNPTTSCRRCKKERKARRNRHPETMAHYVCVPHLQHSAHYLRPVHHRYWLFLFTR